MLLNTSYYHLFNIYNYNENTTDTMTCPPVRHEDGSIRFWDVSSVSVSLLYKLQTMNIFGDGLGEQGAADADEEWPPFRKVCWLLLRSGHHCFQCFTGIMRNRYI